MSGVRGEPHRDARSFVEEPGYAASTGQELLEKECLHKGHIGHQPTDCHALHHSCLPTPLRSPLSPGQDLGGQQAGPFTIQMEKETQKQQWATRTTRPGTWLCSCPISHTLSPLIPACHPYPLLQPGSLQIGWAPPALGLRLYWSSGLGSCFPGC